MRLLSEVMDLGDILRQPVGGATHEAIWQFIASSAVPVYRATPRQQVPIGTGTLLEILDRKYLVTAAHVARLAEAGTLALPTDSKCRAVTTLGPSTVVRGAQDEHDVAIVALDDEHVVERLEAWRFVQPRDLGTPWFTGPFLLYGYPVPATADAGFHRPTEGFGAILGKYNGEISATAAQIDPQYDMLLDWPDRLLEGGLADAPRLGGMSGCSIWAMEPESDEESELWTPTKQLRLVGIQSSAAHGAYLRAKRWHMLWSAFREIDPKAADVVRAVLTAHQERLNKATAMHRVRLDERNAG